MLDRTIVLWTIAACMLAMPVAGQAPKPTTKAFDGAYAGVSRTMEGIMEDVNVTRSCRPDIIRPGPLTIASGAVRYQAPVGTYEGSVNAQGVLVLHGPYGSRLDAQIDGRGAVTGRITSHCSYEMVWQKEGK